jgi:hypothetical protein
MYQSTFLNSATMATSAGVQPFASALNSVPSADYSLGRNTQAQFGPAAARSAAAAPLRPEWKTHFTWFGRCSA